MKRLWFYPIIAVVFMLNTASMCSDDDDDNSSGPSVSDVQQTVTSGTWRVTSFIEDDVDHTSYFTDFAFTFASSGVLTAVRNDTTHTGAWSVTDDDSSGPDFNIMFTAPSNFEEISEDWDILERTSTKLRLRHVSGGDGSIDLLTFQKN